MTNLPVIAICGPAGSGKDLVADWFALNKQFRKIAFADPIKRYARRLFDFSSEQMWGPSAEREHKITYTEHTWLRIIESCVNTANDFLSDLISPNVDRLRAYISLSEWLYNIRNTHRANELLTGTGYITPREVLQTLGTEWGRRSVHPLIWTNYLHEKIVPLLFSMNYNQYQGTIPYQDPNNDRIQGVVIPDARFLNEIHTTQEHGGYVIRLRRLSTEESNKTSNVGIQGHQSEVELRDIPDSEYDLVLELPEGKENVYETLQRVFKEKSWEIKRQVATDLSLMASGQNTA